jgi:DNA-binding CsgD family transcriptional regulator
MKLSRIKQNSTPEVINRETGLTPLQEKAVSLLVTGENFTEVAINLNIDRGTLYNWFEKITFKAYYNRLCSEVKTNVQNNLFGLYSDAMKAIETSLKSDNETIKLKAAFWLLEKLEAQKIDETSPQNMIRGYCNNLSFDFDNFDEVKYKKLCKENGIEP